MAVWVAAVSGIVKNFNELHHVSSWVCAGCKAA